MSIVAKRGAFNEVHSSDYRLNLHQVAETSRCAADYFIMVALWNRADHYIFVLWFLSFFFFSSPNLSRRRSDVYHTSTHGVALVRI